jgi:hypothetical protein
MGRVLIVVESLGEQASSDGIAPAHLPLVSSLKESILANTTDAGIEIRVMTITELKQETLDGTYDPHSVELILPLTLDLPDRLKFDGQPVFQACRDIAGLQKQVKDWDYPVGHGDLWLPIVLTAKGPLYAEVIGVSPDSTKPLAEVRYLQPVHLPDLWRQPLYRLGQQLLQHLQAPPSVYLMRFSIQQEALCFDQLIPFPDEPAIASIGVQSPDLLLCHWLCQTGQPVKDLIVR